MQKYIVLCWADSLCEKRTNTFWEALRIKKLMKSKFQDSYCCIIKVPFRKRHPNFPIWFSLTTLLLVMLFRALD